MAGNRGNKFKFQVQQDIFDAKSMIDETNFYAQRHGQPAELSQRLTWLLGDSTKSFPLAMATMGDIVSAEGGFKKTNSKVKELDDIQFTYPVMSRLNKASVVAKTNSAPNQGFGRSLFPITFTDNWIKRHYIIESPLGIQAYVHSDGVRTSEGNYEYMVELHAVPDTAICPPSELVAGTLWCDLHTANAESESRGTEFKRVAPGKYKNQMGFARLSHQWAGNSANKVMKITISHGGKTMKLWMDFELYQFERAWLEELEHKYWYDRYNRKDNGDIPLKDKMTGKAIPTGAGILEQINNYATYTKLTYNFLQNVVANALFGQSDTDGMSITLYTGRGGMREFDAAMKSAGITQLVLSGGAGDAATKFIQGSNYDLALTGFFNTMYHIDGYIIKVKHNPIFDYGRRAVKSPLHPETGYPLESYRMVFVDDGMFDGEPNLQMVAEKGRRFLHGVVPGLTPMPAQYRILAGVGNIGQGDLSILASDVDASSYHRFASCGVQLRRGNTSLHLECVAGL